MNIERKTFRHIVIIYSYVYACIQPHPFVNSECEYVSENWFIIWARFVFLFYLERGKERERGYERDLAMRCDDC